MAKGRGKKGKRVPTKKGKGKQKARVPKLPLPAREVQKRERIFFGKPKLASKPKTEEINKLREMFTIEWFRTVAEKVKETFCITDEGPTVEMKQILPISLVRRILTTGAYVLSQFPNVVYLDVPEASESRIMDRARPGKPLINLSLPEEHPRLVLVGDTHGTFEVIDHIFEQEGKPSEQRIFVFNGDYVDRGSFSVEVFCTLLALKIRHPDHVHMLRGNHETESVCQFYTLRPEIEAKYGKKAAEGVYKGFLSTFRHLPLAAVASRRLVVIHGGLAGRPDFDLDMLQRLNRHREPEQSEFTQFEFFDPLQDILWSDPMDDDDRDRDGKAAMKFNFSRGVSVLYPQTETQQFLTRCGLTGLVRSHTCVETGHEISHGGLTHTLFSVPSYAEDNQGAYLQLLRRGDELHIVTQRYTLSPHSSVSNQPLVRQMLSNVPFFEEGEEEMQLQDPEWLDCCTLMAPRAVNGLLAKNGDTVSVPTDVDPVHLLRSLLLVSQRLGKDMRAVLACFLKPADILVPPDQEEPLSESLELPVGFYTPVLPKRMIDAAIEYSRLPDYGRSELFGEQPKGAKAKRKKSLDTNGRKKKKKHDN